MAQDQKRVDNPLTLIAIFAGLSETVTLAIIPVVASIEKEAPVALMWFAIIFPTLIVVAFFLTLNWNREVLYAPSDFVNQSHFMNILKGEFREISDAASKLRAHWKPDGATVDPTKENQIRDWMNANGLSGVSVSGFLYSDDASYAKARGQAALALGI